MSADCGHDESWIVMIQGELDVSTKGHLADLAQILAGLGQAVEFDLSGVTFIDPSGWAGVTEAIEHLEQVGLAARVVRPSEPVRRIRTLLGEAVLAGAA